MTRVSLFLIALLLSFPAALADSPVVVDSATRRPLPRASVFSRRGKAIGMTDADGRLPSVPVSALPLTVRYLGFSPAKVPRTDVDTIFLSPSVAELGEVTVATPRRKVMHMLGYVREFSTLTTFSDTVTLFREKMVDFMIVPDPRINFRGWDTPRVLGSRSYYRFTNAQGLDSVSDVSDHHFSWSDWVGLRPAVLPAPLRRNHWAADTLRGKYRPIETWSRQDDRLSVAVNVLAGPAGRKWVPGLGKFFDDVDFDDLRVSFNYGNVVGDSVSPIEVDSYSLRVDSKGRGHKLFRFNRPDEPMFVSTSAEVYVLDKEFISLKEARQWDKLKLPADGVDIVPPPFAPPLPAEVAALVARVDAIDHDRVRLDHDADYSGLAGGYDHPDNFTFGRRLLLMFKDATGISRHRSNRNLRNSWRNFRRELRKLPPPASK